MKPRSSTHPRRILVTRSAHQSSELAGLLRSLGAEPILIPTIQLTEPSSFAALDAALTHLSSVGPDTFHWLVFTSANAVEAFHRRLPSPLPGAKKLRIAAIGPSTARALQAIGLTADLIPPQAVAESLTGALLPHARQRDGLATRFLLVRADEARERLPETLRAAGADVTIAPAYRTIISQDSIPAIRALFAPGADSLDAITFTSSSTVRNLLALCEAAAVAFPLGPLRISIGPITSQTLRNAGLAPDAEAPEATIASLARTAVGTPRARPLSRK
ncbi:MAG TPA: uroporphyrinogen-III synthase [Acidobacteriaceae bacterium]